MLPPQSFRRFSRGLREAGFLPWEENEIFQARTSPIRTWDI
jgi:hypothetical protein